MSHIYTQERTPAGANLSAITMGTLGVAAIFSLLPILMNIPNPFVCTLLAPPPETTIQTPPAPIEDLPVEPDVPVQIEKPIIDETPPEISIDMMAMLLNPRDNGVGVSVDIGKTFLSGDDTIFETFLMDELDQKPRVLVATQPAYPYSMQQAKTKGEVLIEFVIDQNGRVIRPRILSSSDRAFEAAAIEAVLRSKWQPGRKNGKDVRTIVHLPIYFKP